MNRTVLIICIFFLGICYGQTNASLRHVVNDTMSADFFVQLESEKIKYEPERIYFWFKSQELHFSQGNASGYLLNGSFTAYFHSGQLKTKGNFKSGLQHGVWEEWHENGLLKSRFHFEEGVLTGAFVCFDSTGNLQSSGSYKAGDYHGDVVINGEEKKFKNGNELAEKEKKEKEAKNKEKENEDKIESEEKKNDFFKNLLFWKKENNDANKKEPKEEKEKNKEDKREKKERDVVNKESGNE